MPAISEALVREYFELHGFLVRQQRKHLVRGGEEDEEVDFFVWNSRPRPEAGTLPFTLAPADLGRIPRAIVAVKSWHTENFGPAMLVTHPEIARFAEPRFVSNAEEFLGGNLPITKILVLPNLARSAASREKSIAWLREKGVDAVILFRTILGELISSVDVDRNYLKSDELALIRILKKYDLLKESQLELFRTKRRSRE